MTPEQSHDPRQVLRVSGADARDFLQGLVTNDLRKLDQGAIYAALQTPQGKYIADFFLIADGDDVLIDLAADQAPGVTQKLKMYKLRAKVDITVTDLGVTRGLGTPPEGAFADPRHPDMGWRLYEPGVTEPPEQAAEMDALRISLGIPAAGIELVPGETFILEAGFEALNGVDFRKGCFVGQEIVARMKHKTELRKGLRQVRVTGSAPVGTPILRDGKPVGTLFSQADGLGIAHLRLDRVGPGMMADTAEITLPTDE